METDKVLKELGVGLSLFLRYSYGGFLLIVLASIVNPTAAGKVFNSMSWELAGLSAVVLGAGIYALHRSVVIPVHHYILCVAFWAWDIVRCVPRHTSDSPTRWLHSINVSWGNRILAYTAVRRSDFFGGRKKMIDLAHAESGLVVMTSEGFLVAGLYAWINPDGSAVRSIVLFILAAIFSLASYPSGWVQHRRECRVMRLRRTAVEKILRQEGFLQQRRELGDL
jgi:hypothetical protein